MPIFDELGREIAAQSRMVGEFGTSLVFSPTFFDSKPIDGLHCGVGLRHRAVSNELCHVDFNIDGHPMRVELKAVIVLLLTLGARPHLESFGKVAFREVPEGVIVLLSEQSKVAA
jgi:hypothetical protein